MYQNTPLIVLTGDSQDAITLTTESLASVGLQVVRSFDLQVARAAHVGCTCPNHGTDQCDCHMVVLLVYGQAGSPVTLVFHGHDGQTQIALVDTPEQRPSSQMVNAIIQAILPTAKPGRKGLNFRLEDGYHAG